MDSTNQPDEVLELALQLAPRDRLRLIEQVAASVERDMPVTAPVPREDSAGHWGQNLNRLLDELGPIELAHPEIDDPVEWVKQIRQDQAAKRGLDWGDEE